MRILVFDNYDSFTWNLVHLVEKIVHSRVDVIRNDQLELEDMRIYDKIILSPGPGLPKDAGLLLALVREYAASKSILGVCLGHQAIGEAFGGQLVNLETVYHGVATQIRILPDSCKSGRPDIFRGLPATLEVGRYHSWVISNQDFPDDLEVTARDENDLIMALRHRSFDLQGLQFHPESVLTTGGEKILSNWLRQ